MNGAAIYKNLFTYGGMRSSLVISLMTSASGCIKPCGPTREGPMRTWMCAMTLRSTHCKYASVVSRTKATTAALIRLSRKKFIYRCPWLSTTEFSTLE